MLRSLVFLAAALLLPMAANAQQQAPAQPEQTAAAPPPRGDCSKVDLAGDKSLAEIELVKACLEAKAIADPQGINSLSPAMATVLAAVIGLVTAGIGYFVKHMAERGIMKTQFEYQQAGRYEEHIGQLLDQLSASNDARQMFAVEGLTRLASELSRRKPPKRAPPQDPAMPLKVLISTLRSGDRSDSVKKFTADELAKLFKPGQSKFRMRDFNLQNVNLSKAWWSGVDASGADLFEANLKEASLRGANLQGAVLYGANLEGTVFKGANLKDANLSAAQNINKAIFDATTQWNARTQWPQGFTPSAQGLGAASA